VVSTLEVRHITPVPVGCRIRARVFLKELSEATGGLIQSIREVVFEREGKLVVVFFFYFSGTLIIIVVFFLNRFPRALLCATLDHEYTQASNTHYAA
jgi:hypothetical protein